VNPIFEARRRYSQEVLTRLREHLRSSLGDRHDPLIGAHTFVYATGSCGREEMGPSSDLDAYVVRMNEANREESEELQRAIEQANSAAGLPPLDAGGRYTRTVGAVDLIDRLGAPEDDSREDGAFTKRMLLMLESRVLLGEEAYAAVMDRVIDAYWQNADLHPTRYQPFVLVNDIVRWWRIVLLNHESRLRKRRLELLEETGLAAGERGALLLAERLARSYKMRFARCLTCFSALTYLLALTPHDVSHVSKKDVLRMIELSPLARIQRLEELAGRELSPVCGIQSLYAGYLQRSENGRQALVDSLRADREFARQLGEEGGEFTRLMFVLVEELGGGRRLHRHMLV